MLSTTCGRVSHHTRIGIDASPSLVISFAHLAVVLVDLRATAILAYSLLDLFFPEMTEVMQQRTEPSLDASDCRPPEIILLVGAGASGYLGLPTLDNLLGNLEASADDASMHLLRQTRASIMGDIHRISVAVFEELIARLKYYLQITETLMRDYTFQGQLGVLNPDVVTGVFARKWKDALTKCYRLLIEEFGPDKIRYDTPEFLTTIKLMAELAKLNSGNLHIYTTNYDCSYQVMATRSDELCFFSHIHDERGTFHDGWYPIRPSLVNLPLPSIYIHRLHGCVAWFTREEPYEIFEIYGSGGGLEIANEDLLHKMCIKLVTTQEIGKNVAFLSAYEEFCNHLESARALIIWGSSFRDMEVLRAINNAFAIRKTPLPIYYINPYKGEVAVAEAIRYTLKPVPVVVSKHFVPKQINWMLPQSGEILIDAVINAVRRKPGNATRSTARQRSTRN